MVIIELVSKICKSTVLNIYETIKIYIDDMVILDTKACGQLDIVFLVYVTG